MGVARLRKTNNPIRMSTIATKIAITSLISR